MAGVLTMAFVLAGNVYAASQNSNSGTAPAPIKPIEQRTQTDNQGEASQVRTQNSEQVQAGINAGTGAATPTMQKAQQKLQDGTGAGGQIKNQNQEKNQEKAGQSEDGQRQGEQNKNGTATATQRRSQVANTIQEMLRLADRNGGIGQQVRIIAQTQTQNQEKLEMSLQKVQSRSGFAKFFVGPNYGEVNNAKKLLEQNQEQVKQLNQIKDQLADQGDQQILIEQIKTLEQADLEIQSSLGVAQKGFSLLGWVFRAFSK